MEDVTMSLKVHHLIPVSLIVFSTMVFAAIAAVPTAAAQAPTLEEQLTAQYKLVKMGSDTGGYSVVDKGTLLAIQKGGILGVPYSDNTVLSTKYESGTVHSPSGLSVVGRKSIMGRFGKEQTTHLFQVGDKVYPSKVEVNLAKDIVTIGIVACDTCNKTDPPTYNKANVVFVFPKGTLASANAGSVEDTIGQLLAVSNDDQAGQQGADQGAQPQGGDQGGQQPPAAAPQQPAAQDQPPAEPASIDKGMTPDQVQAALGKPDKIVNLGSKQIYVYKDLKVTFLNGKVSDVQ
jgi:hypothetical protein